MKQNNDEIFELLAKYFAGESSGKEKQYIKIWQEKDEENRKEFDLMKKIMENKEENFLPDTERALKDVMQRLPDQKNPFNHHWKIILRIAAVFLIALSLSYGGYKIYINNTSRLITYTQSSNIVSQVLLPDGTEVWLRKNATIQYPNRFIGKTRKINFDGEGFFKVYHDAKHPFYIHTAHSETRVLGTRFLLRTNTPDSLVVLIVEEGQVMFSGNNLKTTNNQKLVVAGEKAILNEKTNDVSLTLNDDNNYQSWRTKKLIFDQTRLKNVIRDVENLYQIKFDSIPSNLDSIPVTAVYNGLTLNELLENLQLTLSVTIEDVGGIYQIKPRS